MLHPIAIPWSGWRTNSFPWSTKDKRKIPTNSMRALLWLPSNQIVSVDAVLSVWNGSRVPRFALSAAYERGIVEFGREARPSSY